MASLSVTGVRKKCALIPLAFVLRMYPAKPCAAIWVVAWLVVRVVPGATAFIAGPERTRRRNDDGLSGGVR